MPKRPVRPEDLLSLQIPCDPQFSPSGEKVVLAVKSVGEKNKVVSRLHEWSPGGVRQLTFGNVSDGPAKWRPDGAGFAFSSDRAKPFNQIFYMAADGGEPRAISNLPEGSLTRFEWSPDGRQIAFLFRQKSEGRTAAAKKAREETGESEPPWEIESLVWRLDGDGVFGGDRFALYVLDFESGEHRVLVSQAADGEYAFCWMPDSQTLLVAYNTSERPTMEPWREDLFLVDAGSGTPRPLTGYPVGNFSALSAQLGGRQVAMLYQDRSEDRFGIKSNLLALFDPKSGEFRTVTGPEIDLAVHVIGDCRDAPDPRLIWSRAGSRVYANLSVKGSTQVVAVDVQAGRVEPVTSGRGEWTLGSSDGAGRFAVCRPREDGFPEVAIVDSAGVEEWRSEFNACLEAEVELSLPEEHWVESEPGVQVQTWVLRPLHGDQQCPAAIEVHGGPHGMYHSCVFLEMQLLAAAGYVVVFGNIRGSTGYGEEFARCIMGDWGVKDWSDVEAITRFAKDLPYVDAERVGILGGSYGGYMVNWAIGHSTEYRAAVTDRCVSNLISKSGNSDYTFVPDGVWPGAAYERWEHLWDRSPVKHFKNARTPTLVIHSEGDLRCHIEQGEQVFAFLQQLEVPTRMVRYPPNTSHGMSRTGPPDMRIHRLREILAWLGRYL